MELTNKRTSYTVENESSKVRFSGVTAAVAGDTLRSVGGSATSLDGTKNGWFDLQLTGDNVAWNYNGSPDIEDDVRDLVRTTTEEFAAHLNTESA